MKKAIVISGWAHGIDAIRPVGDALSEQFDVQLLTGNQVLKEQTIPESDVIVTGSMGGLLAMELLPESCKKLVLISSTARFCATADYPCGTHEKILKRMIMQLKQSPESVLNDFFKNVHHPNQESRRSILLRCEAMPDWADLTKQDASSTLIDLAAGLEYLLNTDVRSMVPAINIPAQLFHGSEDRIIPLGAAEWLNKNLPDSRLTVYEDGHALAAHHFKPMMQELRKFLAE
jgi:pimeloyl-[acyl-carrier protein] methyl ester esterase